MILDGRLYASQHHDHAHLRLAVADSFRTPRYPWPQAWELRNLQCRQTAAITDHPSTHPSVKKWHPIAFLACIHIKLTSADLDVVEVVAPENMTEGDGQQCCCVAYFMDFTAITPAYHHVHQCKDGKYVPQTRPWGLYRLHLPGTAD